jgi:aldose 1-epimerase
MNDTPWEPPAPSSTLPPSGQQVEIRQGNQRATIVEVGGGLREYRVGGLPVLDGYAEHEMANGGRGQPLLPWPNRLQDGRYEFRGQTLQLPLNEVDHRNAIHGLTRWANWTVSSRDEHQVTMSLVLHPQSGYPFTLALAIDYLLSDEGLSVRTGARNIGSDPLPYGAGQHPYLTVGTEFIDTAQLRVPAQRILQTDNRQIPTGRLLEVAGSDRDFREFRSIGSLRLDTCYTDLERGFDRLARVDMRADGSGVALTLWMDAHYPYVMIFSGDTLAPARRRKGLAVEPMTCPANAFRTGSQLAVLEPGHSFESHWGLLVHQQATSQNARGGRPV